MPVVSFEGADAERTIGHRGDGLRGLWLVRLRPVPMRQAAAAASSAVTASRNVADGTKNSVPVTARLKSSSRS